MEEHIWPSEKNNGKAQSVAVLERGVSLEEEVNYHQRFQKPCLAINDFALFCQTILQALPNQEWHKIIHDLVLGQPRLAAETLQKYELPQYNPETQLIDFEELESLIDFYGSFFVQQKVLLNTKHSKQEKLRRYKLVPQAGVNRKRQILEQQRARRTEPGNRLMRRAITAASDINIFTSVVENLLTRQNFIDIYRGQWQRLQLPKYHPQDNAFSQQQWQVLQQNRFFNLLASQVVLWPNRDKVILFPKKYSLDSQDVDVSQPNDQAQELIDQQAESSPERIKTVLRKVLSVIRDKRLWATVLKQVLSAEEKQAMVKGAKLDIPKPQSELCLSVDEYQLLSNQPVFKSRIQRGLRIVKLKDGRRLLSPAVLTGKK